ncbi:MAG: prolyl oligopeptidase family serine peptidase [Woeseiaceae bacterium]|nr:prolyl oligopeptidase family serine peptidase [Woeseiaceae bacterium]
MPFQLIPTFVLMAVLIAACGRDDTHDDDNMTMEYPQTATVEQVDVYHGTEVADPYRWLEDDVRENPDVRAWVEAQNELTFGYLAGIEEREAIAGRLTELWDFERFGIPVRAGGRYFYTYNDGLQNQDLVYRLDALDADARLLVDPNTWSEDGTIALADFFPSPDGQRIAYLVQDGGSDWRTARVMNAVDGSVLEDRLEWLKFTELDWAADGSGFYYSRFPEVDADERFQSLNQNSAVYFHRIGDAQANDTLVFATPDEPEWMHGAEVTDDGRHLVITTVVGTDDRYRISWRDLTADGADFVTLMPGFDYDYTLIGSVGDELLFRSNDGAPRNRVIAIDPRAPGRDRWREVIPESQDVLTEGTLVGGRLIAHYLQDAWSVVRIFDLDGNETGSVNLPGIGTASGFEGDADNPETFFEYSSYDTPPTINRLDVATGEVTLFRAPEVPFDPAEFVVRQLFFTSKDGTRVPMFVSHRRDIEADGQRPTLLYGYGGFNVSLTPEFSVSRLAWMELGGVYAVANLRGGGEYGREWHQAGTKLDKQNVFDDFIAAAEYLIDSGYTNPSRLAIMGGSNGGLLVGAVTNQRPELFAAALPAVGVMDMLRFHRFTAGRFWTDDYGSADDPEAFAALHAYSPYHNVVPGTRYPAVLVTTADTDDRVVPGHSFKYAAALQAAQGGDAPVLIRIETRAGHGAGVPTEKVIAEYADRWAFLAEHLGMTLPEGYGEDGGPD